MNDAPSRPGGSASSARRWGPLAAWVALLLLATSWPNPHVPDVRNGDKAVHTLLYGVLAFLGWRAAVPPDGRPAALSHWLVRVALVVAAASAFGWADEWHQQFIPGRSRSTADWQADTLGAVLGVAVGAAAAALHREPSS